MPTSSTIQNHPDKDDSSLHSGDNNEDNDDQNGTLMEACEWETTTKMEQDQTSHERCSINESAEANGDQRCEDCYVVDEDIVITLVAYYCQNMEMPFFGKDQPGETYHYMPKNNQPVWGHALHFGYGGSTCLWLR
jgi:hypothetical protein